MMQLLEFFLAEGFEITFATTASKTEFAVDLLSYGIATEKIELNNASFDGFVKKLQPAVVLFDRFMMEEQFGWRVSEVCPGTIKILDTEDLHFLRKARREAFKKGVETDSLLLESDIAKREIASIYRCDISLIISGFEMQLLQKTFGLPQNLLFYLPFLIENPSEEMISKFPLFEYRSHFISIGNFRHEPNWDAVLNLKENIWPLIRTKIKEAEIHIFGSYAPEKVFQLHDPKSGFLVKGWAESASEEIQNSRVLLAPLRFGAGMKGKFIDAMLAGTPSVTTSIGAEGMAGEKDWNGAVENSPEGFAEAAIELYLQKELWIEAQKKGFEILRDNFSKEEHQNRFRQIIDFLKNNLQKHRKANFTGKMLVQQAFNSTKFLSKYIEAKNKLERLEEMENARKTGVPFKN